MKRIIIYSLLSIFLVACGGDTLNNVGQHSAGNNTENTVDSEGYSKNYKKIANEFAKYNFNEEIVELKSFFCEVLDAFLMKNGMKDIEEVCDFQFEWCKIKNTDKKDVLMRVYVSDEIAGYTYFMPFLYDGKTYYLDENMVVAYTHLEDYQFIDIDGDDINEIQLDYCLSHNGTDRIIQILKYDANKNSHTVFFKSVNAFSHELKYGFSNNIPKKFWIEDTKTYINTDKKRKVAKRVKTVYNLRDGKYKKKSEKQLEKSDMKDFYEWTLG